MFRRVGTARGVSRLFSNGSVTSSSSSSTSGGGHTTKKKTTMLDDHHFCVNLVRSRDKDGYLCGLLQPSGASRDAYFAIRAFNVEIASIKDGTTVRSSGSVEASCMRMHWWREAVEDMYRDDPASNTTRKNKAAVRHAVVRSLHRAVQDHGLTKRFLDKMVDARERDLECEQLDTMRDLVRYGEDTWASLMYLSLESVGVRDPVADDVAFHIGVAHAITTTLRSTPHRAARGELSIPLELMERHSIPSTYLLRPENDSFRPALRDAVFEMASVARSHLNKARELQGQVPTAGRVSLLPAVGAGMYLEKLDRVADFDVLHTGLYVDEGGIGSGSVVWHPLLLGRAWLTGVF